jgi:PAS domain S-box-containing protein
MITPGLHPEESARLEGLRQLDILDTPSEERFDRITRIAASLFDVPFAVISLVDSERQWFKACIGLTVRETPRDISFCGHTILGTDVLYIPDAQNDPRFFDNPLVVNEPHIRLYAGCPLKGPNGFMIGTLCIMDRKPRELTPQDLNALRDLGSWAHTELTAMHLLQKELARQKDRFEESEHTFLQFLESLPVGVFVLTASGKPYYANQTAQQILGKGIAPGASPEDLAEVYQAYIAGTDIEYPTDRMPVVRALSGRSTTVDDLEIHGPNGRIQIQIWGTPIFRKGVVTYAIVAFQDVTERKRAEHRLAAQHSVTQVLAQAGTLEEATPKILQAICASIGCECGALWRINPAEQILECVDVWHRPTATVDEFEALTRRFTMTAGVGLPGRVWASKEPAWVPDIVEDSNFPRTPAALKNGLHAAFAFPVLFKNEVTGVLEFFSRFIQKPDNELLTMVGTLGSQIGQFIARKQTEEALDRTEERLRAVETSNTTHT